MGYLLVLILISFIFLLVLVSKMDKNHQELKEELRELRAEIQRRG
jgi:hypothetical protein